MAKCGDCLHFRTCSHYVTPEETFPEVGGCSAFKSKGDFVEVVRCKDCKHCCLDLSGRDAHLCMRKEVGFVVRRKLDDFCSYGERREGE